MLCHRLLVAVCLLVLPAAARAVVTYRAQGYAGAHDGFYGVYYGNFSQEIASPAFQNLVSLGRAQLGVQSVPFKTSSAPINFGLVGDPGRFNFVVGDDNGNVFSYYGQGAATATASFTGTSLHASASVVGKIDPLSYTWTDDEGHPQTSPNYITFHGLATALIGMSDVVTISSGSLPKGTPVMVRLTGTLHSGVHDEQGRRYMRSGSFAAAYFSLGNDTISLRDGDGYGDPHLPDDQRTKTIEVEVHVGDRLVLDQALSVGAEGLVFFNGDPSVNNYADAGNTSFMYLDPLTPGVTLTTDSGLSYASPVPEPGVVGVIGASILVARRRRPGF